MSSVVLAAAGLLPLKLQAATPPASVSACLITTYSMAHTSSGTFFQKDGGFYDTFSHAFSSDLPLRIGTYVYTPNSDGTATLSLSYRTADGTLTVAQSTLTFDTDTSGHIGYPGNTFSIEAVTDHATLSNISSRSLVSPSVQAMAGFVVSGTTPRLYLVRAVGPTLRQYGVNDAVSDVSLKIFKGSATIAQNDDWEKSSTSSADLSHAFVQVGAFPLPSGSKDSAILIVLEPGIYTVQGSSTENGELLVEVYQGPEPQRCS